MCELPLPQCSNSNASRNNGRISWGKLRKTRSSVELDYLPTG